MTPGADERARPVSTRTWWAALVLTAGINGLLLSHFHDRYWYPTDDGLYAHVAHRLLEGEVLNRDIQDIHPGYIHFVHATALRVFGLDLVSLRYPLMAAAFAQALVLFALLAHRGLLPAVAGSVAGTALGVLQFISPTSNWYALGLAFALAWWMTRIPVGHPARLPGAGVLLGCLAMFRHLSGVWAAMAVVVLVIIEHRDAAATGRRVVARTIVSIMFAALIWYLLFSPETEPGGLLLMAAWPGAILAWLLVRVRTNDADLVRALIRVGAGTAIPVLPLVLYHAMHGSMAAWVRDNIFAAAGETQMAFFGQGWYGLLPLAAFHQVVTSADPARIANGLYWMALPVLSAVNGWLVLARVRRGGNAADLALPMIACFYALVSLYLEGPLYLYYSAGLSLASILWLAGRRDAPRVATSLLAAGLGLVAIAFHAGQSRLRTPTEILSGRRTSDVWTNTGASLPRVSLRIDERDRKVYGSFISLIERETSIGDAILALPNDAELYFLTGRQNPSRFYNSALGLTTANDTDQLLDVLAARPPALVIFRPDDKYNNEGSARVMAFVESRYDRIEVVDGAEIYRLR